MIPAPLARLNGALLIHADALLQLRHAQAMRALAGNPLTWALWASWAELLGPRVAWTAWRVRVRRSLATAAWGRGELDKPHRSARSAAYRDAQED